MARVSFLVFSVVFSFLLSNSIWTSSPSVALALPLPVAKPAKTTLPSLIKWARTAFPWKRNSNGGISRPNATGKPTALASLSTAEIASFRPYATYAGAAYCQPKALTNWTCGNNCKAHPSFEVITTGGTGNKVQFWYVGVDPTLKTVIVAHQGTNPKKLLPVLTDLKARRTGLDTKLFPGLPSGIKVHHGFADAQARTAPSVLVAVKEALAKSDLKQVTIVGHSLGGAIALLDGVYLPLHIPHVSFKVITFGQPRVGNAAFAAYVNQKVDLVRVTNRNDVVPVIPGRGLGYRHAKGEKHIQADGVTWLDCPGGDNADPRCSVGDVNNIFVGSVTDHSGPYDGITIKCEIQ